MSASNGIKSNKSFQTFAGALTIYMTWWLWKEGWIDWLRGGGYESEEGFGNTQLWLSIGAALLNFVQMVGIFSIAVVSGIIPHADEFLRIVLNWIKSLTAKLRDMVVAYNNREKKEGEFNWKPAVALLVGWFIFVNGHLVGIKKKIIDVIPDVVPLPVDDEVVIDSLGKGKAILFSINPKTVSQSQNLLTLSGKLDLWLLQNKIERRRILSTQSMMNSEVWAKAVAEAAPDEENSLVVWANGEVVSVHKIPENYDDIIQIISTELEL
jgi:hypothetical protein